MCYTVKASSRLIFLPFVFGNNTFYSFVIKIEYFMNYNIDYIDFFWLGLTKHYTFSREKSFVHPMTIEKSYYGYVC